jgi:hypothetical protein
VRRLFYDPITVRTSIRLGVVCSALALGVCTAWPPAVLHASAQRSASAVLQRFLARADGPPVSYRALRRLEAKNGHFRAAAWMEAWTEFNEATGFKYEIVGEGGSGYIRGRVLKAALEGEKKMWAEKEPDRAALTRDNYEFKDGGTAGEGLEWLGIKPRRKDVLLVEGAIFVEPEEGELTRIEGKLSKAPSMWTRGVEIIRKYERIGGVRVPVSIESTAHVLIAGLSTFRMTYEYETINGVRVGDPQPR